MAIVDFSGEIDYSKRNYVYKHMCTYTLFYRLVGKSLYFAGW